ncbi:nitrate reductase molybdenum cofactor assembly chaperone [Rhodococcus sp. 15-2388-1-1a]|uniref:nitrate reductase molybdenum cofactor assembly chaperone n=1 Tax=Nocardiaceae TaxID=85025 RepID=UPI00056BED60|nr:MULTISPECIES: nitrate reductase molybdenum cofactor assembly chaperone [Rhodococcus]OZE99175.1 nitrate reductase molybdenum cofactor assembly chaperone [Rhodococcus sp. 15-2388-1-1a]
MRWLRGRREVDQRVIYQAAAWCLTYPDSQLLSRIGLLREALGEHPDRTVAAPLERFVDHLAGSDIDKLQREYVDVFDLSSKRTLYLSYWTDGDTRRRGSVLGEFKQRYRDSGYLVDLHGELPDHLPVVLEFCARDQPATAVELLTIYRAALELIRLGLVDLGTPYADVMTAICACLPGESPTDRQSALALRATIPIETVGLEAFDPRLLPIAETR